MLHGKIWFVSQSRSCLHGSPNFNPKLLTSGNGRASLDYLQQLSTADRLSPDNFDLMVGFEDVFFYKKRFG
jgi:hypothetical protein